MAYSNMDYIPLRSAYLCPDCNTIGNCATQCPACASRALMGLSAILDREVEQESKPLAQMPSATYHSPIAMVA
jgi:coenzyme F420-reducing hydrogenase gamma subunit